MNILLFILSIFYNRRNNKTISNKTKQLYIKRKNIDYKYLNTNIELCPISSYKQCTNNYNIYNKVENMIEFNKPYKENRVNIWNSM